MIQVDKLSYTSKLRYVNATTKFAFAMITLFICVMSRSIVIASIVFGTTGILTVYKGGIPLSRYMRLLRVPLLFLLLSIIAIFIQINKEPLDAFSISLGGFYITGSYHGMYEGIKLFATAFASISCLYFLTLSTPITDILIVLKGLRCPDLIIELMLLIYRFIFVLLELAKNMQIAQQCRLSNKNLPTAIKSMGALMSTLFLRAFQKSARLYDAMESRCYDGTIKVLVKKYPVNKKIVITMVVYELLLLVCVLIERLVG